MPSSNLHYRFRIRTATDEADLFIATSLPTGINPFIAEAPSGDGSTLDPLTGKVTVGAYTVKVIDAPGVVVINDGSPITDGLEYANQGAAESAGWVFADTMNTGSITVAATDQVHGGSKSFRFNTTTGGGSGAGLLTATRVFDAGDGILADTLYEVSVWGRMDHRDYFDVRSRLIANGVEAAITTAGAWEQITVTVRSSASATLSVQLYRQQAFIKRNRSIWWDDLSLQPLTPGTTTEGRVVTSVLADSEARQQLLSKRAFVEESTDEGANWTVLDNGGYINTVKMNDALLWEFTVGDSKRVEQSKRVFDRISDPVEHPLFIGTLDRASCIVGGPIVGDWGGVYVDRGRPLFEVTDTIGADLVRLAWRNGGGSLHGVYKEDGPPMRDHIADFINASALEYLDKDSDTGGSTSYAACPGLVARIYDADTSEWVSDQIPMMFHEPILAAGSYLLTGNKGEMVVRWDGTLPSEGDQFRMAIFPRAISDRNPIHWDGHPMDLVANCLDYCGIAYNLASLQAMGEALGLDLKVHLRVTEGDTCQSFLEKTVYGPFGVAARLNDDGEVEFVLSRSPDTVSSGTVTTADVAGELEGMPWGLEESSAANRVVLETQSHIIDDRTPDSATPFDAMRSAKVEVDLKAEDVNELEVYGDREVSFRIPGSIQVAGAILATGTQTAPGSLDLWVKALAKPLFDWQGRGAIRAELDLRRGVTTAKIGDVLTLDLEYFPSANVEQSPVSQRGTDARRAVVLRRTVKPDRVSLLLEDRGLAAELECDPTFTLDADATFPKTTVTVEVTNEVDLTSPIRVEMAQGASEPSSAGQFVRLFHPNRDANPFNLPPVCAGNTVWVRMRCELNGQVGTWTAWDSIDLADLTAPSSLSAVVNNTSILLSWTNGETTYPVEILARLDADTTLQSVAVLPAGSTSYTLLLTQASTDYVLGVRYVDPKGCTSATTTVSASTDVQICLEPPSGLAPFADGLGTYGVEMDAATAPGAVEVWVATETSVGSGTAGTYALADTVQALTPPLRTRWVVTSPVPNDGLLRYMKAQSVESGYTSCSFSDPVSVNPWVLVDPNPPGDPGDPSETPITTQPARVPLIRPGQGGLMIGLPDDDRASPSPSRVPEAKAVLTGVTSARIDAIVYRSSLPVGAYLAVEFEPVISPGEWRTMEDDTDDADLDGPRIPLDPASLALLDTAADASGPWNISGDWITVREDARDDVRLRVRIGGGDGSGVVLLGDVDLEPSYSSLVDVPSTPDPPTEDPGSCDVPTPQDMNTGWTGGDDTGAVWSAGSDTSYTLTMDGTGTGENAWEKTFTGLTASQQYTFYLDVTTTVPDVVPFLEVVGGDTDTATETGTTTLVARGDSDGSGNLTVRWGVEDLGSVPSTFFFEDALDYAALADYTSAGWTLVTTSGGTLSVDTTETAEQAHVLKASVHNSGTAYITRTFACTPGTHFTLRGRGRNWQRNGLDTSSRIEFEPGPDSAAQYDFWVDKSVATTIHVSTVTIRVGRMGGFFGIGGTYYGKFAGIVLDDGTGGGSGTVLFEDLGSCLGSGLSQTPDEPTGAGGGGDDPVPDPPPGGYPPPPVGGTRPFGAYALPTGGGIGYWNSTVKKLRAAFGVNTVNATVNGDMKNLFVFGETSDWLTGGRFDYNKWKAIIDEVYTSSALNTLLESAITSGNAWAHHVIDEPYHPTRYGGPIPLTTVEKMCLYSKSKWPTWRTLIRVAPTFPWITRKITGCDTLWAEYLTRRGDCATFRDENIARAVELGHTLVLGIHYYKFHGEVGPDTPITPSELEHYGGILWNTNSSAVVAAHGWQYSSKVWNQPGFPETLHQRRDAFNALDP